jgi:hypothetical protein
LELEAGFVVVMGYDGGVVVMGGVAGVDAVWAVDQSGVMLARLGLGKEMGWAGVLEVVELPVVPFLNVENSAFLIWQGLV